MDEATPRPWKWNETSVGWRGDFGTPGGELTGDKYLDLGLLGADGRYVLPLRLDHYEIVFDGYPQDFKEADRALIVKAVNHHDTLLGLVRDMRSDLLALGYSEDCQILTRARDILKPEEPNEQTVP